jgi:hypothetical protein
LSFIKEGGNGVSTLHREVAKLALLQVATVFASWLRAFLYLREEFLTTNSPMVRQPCCDKVGLKTGPWTAEEDQKLVTFLLNNGHCCWRAVPKLAGA